MRLLLSQRLEDRSGNANFRFEGDEEQELSGDHFILSSIDFHTEPHRPNPLDSN